MGNGKLCDWQTWSNSHGICRKPAWGLSSWILNRFRTSFPLRSRCVSITVVEYLLDRKQEGYGKVGGDDDRNDVFFWNQSKTWSRLSGPFSVCCSRLSGPSSVCCSRLSAPSLCAVLAFFVLFWCVFFLPFGPALVRCFQTQALFPDKRLERCGLDQTLTRRLCREQNWCS